jgi:hypothetical protein
LVLKFIQNFQLCVILSKVLVLALQLNTVRLPDSEHEVVHLLPVLGRNDLAGIGRTRLLQEGVREPVGSRTERLRRRFFHGSRIVRINEGLEKALELIL